MAKKILFVAFALLVLSIPIYLMLTSENVLENGYRHKIKLQAYDPFDPFRGKYLRLNYNNEVQASNLKKGDPIYITLKKDALGYSEFHKGFNTPPSTADYFKAEVLYYYDNYATFRTDNISKYFINEDKVKAAEGVVIDYQRNHPDSIYVAIRVLNGEIRLEDIYVEETPLLEFITKK